MAEELDMESVIDSKHEGSKRTAILQQTETSGWLFLTLPDETRPIADSFVYNRIEPIPPEKVADYRGGPPPIADRFAGDDAVIKAPLDEKFELRWSIDGESVCLLRDGKPSAMIAEGHPRGYSKAIKEKGPWGSPWDAGLYRLLFGDPEAQ